MCCLNISSFFLFFFFSSRRRHTRCSRDWSSDVCSSDLNFADDQGYLRALLPTPVSYIGMLGPRQRTERILRNLSAEDPVAESRVYAPVEIGRASCRERV